MPSTNLFERAKEMLNRHDVVATNVGPLTMEHIAESEEWDRMQGISQTPNSHHNLITEGHEAAIIEPNFDGSDMSDTRGGVL